MLVFTVIFLNASLRGKYLIIYHTIDSLAILPKSQVLDIGTGHGAVLLEVAKYLKVPGKVARFEKGWIPSNY
jgi:precorrin-6B methylase 2